MPMEVWNTDHVTTCETKSTITEQSTILSRSKVYHHHIECCHLCCQQFIIEQEDKMYCYQYTELRD